MKVHKTGKERLFEMFENVNKTKVVEKEIVKGKNGEKINEWGKVVKPSRVNESFLKEEKFYDFILQGHEATEENAYNTARGLDWQSVETQETNFPDLQYIDSVNGVGIYYHTPVDAYYFTDENSGMEESFDNPIEKDHKYLNKGNISNQPKVSKPDDGTRYPVEDKFKVKDPSLEKMRGDDAPIVEAGEENIAQEIYDELDMRYSHTTKNIPFDEINDVAEMYGAQPEDVAQVAAEVIAKNQNQGYEEITDDVKELITKFQNTNQEIHQISPKAAWEVFEHEYQAGSNFEEFLQIWNKLTKDPAQTSMFETEDDQEVADQNSEESDDELQMDEPVPNDGSEEIGGEVEPEGEIEIELGGGEVGGGEPEMGDMEMGSAEISTPDEIEGGLGDDASVSDNDPDQIAKGIKVEMEHTDDPKIALEIVLDHLVEDPMYYGKGGEDPDAAAMAGAQVDSGGEEGSIHDIIGGGNEEIPEEPTEKDILFGKLDTVGDMGNDEELEDMEFNFEPKNVGEDFDFAGQERDYYDKQDNDNSMSRYQELTSKGPAGLRPEEHDELKQLEIQMGIDPMQKGGITPDAEVPMEGVNEYGMNDDFIPHGSYTVSNSGGYEVMLSDSGDAAKVRDAFGSDNPKTSDWLEIEYVGDEAVIDPNGYNIPLNQVMRIN